MKEKQLSPKKYVLDVTIPGLPATYNGIGRKSHWVKIRNTNEWKENVRAVVGRFLPPEPLKKARCSFIRYSSAPADYDGIVHSMKPVVDGLVSCGVLADDSLDVIGAPTYKWEKAQRGKGYIQIRVEEAA